MTDLEGACRKFLGLPPYDDCYNPLVGDNYYYKSICDRFGEAFVEKMLNNLRIQLRR